MFFIGYDWYDWYDWILPDIIGHYRIYWLISLDITGYILLLLLDTCCQFKFRLSWASPSKLHYTSLPFRIEHPEHPKKLIVKKMTRCIFRISEQCEEQMCGLQRLLCIWCFSGSLSTCLRRSTMWSCAAHQVGAMKGGLRNDSLNSRFLLHLTSATSYSNHTVIIISYSDEWWS